VLTPRMAAVPARHTQVTIGQLTFSEVLARAKRKRPAANSGTKSASTTLGCRIRGLFRSVLPFGPENTMNYTVALGAPSVRRTAAYLKTGESCGKLSRRYFRKTSDMPTSRSRSWGGSSP
jgi:hypothetical protein